MQTRNLIAWVIAAAALLPLGGCNRDDSPSARVVVYTSVDQPVAEPILREFEKKTGIKVDVQTDTEATKSAGLAARLQAEKANPQADVWWGNEVFHTINLAESGVLAAYDSPSANDIPQQFKDPQHRWAGYCLRARVLAVSAATGAPPDVKNVTGLEAMRNPAFKNRVAMARPSAGTTGGHVAALYVIWGDEKADAFFRDLRGNGVKLLGGNSVVADQVGQGTVWVGMTDNDDVDAAKKAGGRLEMVLPDQGPEAQGTLTIPCTAGLVTGAKHTDAAKKLIDYLLSAEVERKLIDAKFGRYSVRGGAGSEAVKTMSVDYAAAARALPKSVERAIEIVEGRK
jgi:iron(III) transport system substrate-binding protein